MATKKADDGRANLLAVVKTPLIFFALGLLVIEGLFTLLLTKGVRAEDTLLIVMIMAALFVLVVLVVAWLTWKIPGALMGQLREVARDEVEAVFDTRATRWILGQLKTLQYDLEAFDGQRRADEMQRTSRAEQLSQNPYIVYIKPVTQRVLESQHAANLPPVVLDQLQQLSLSGSSRIADVRQQLGTLLAHSVFGKL